MLTAETKAARRNYICSSDPARICTGLDGRPLSPYGGPLHVYAEKLEGFETEETDEMRWGNRMESVIFMEYIERVAGLKSIHPPMIVSERWPWLAANLDAIRCDGRIVEAKNTQSRTGWGTPGSDEVPQHILIQVQEQMAVAEAECADVAAAICGAPAAVYTVPRSEPIIDRIVELSEIFWTRHVLPRVPPEPDWTDPATRRLLEAIQRPEAGKIVDLGAEALQWADAWRAAGLCRKFEEGRREEARARLVALMGDAESARLPDGSLVKRKLTRRNMKAAPARVDEFWNFTITTGD